MPPARERRWWTSEEDEILKNGVHTQCKLPTYFFKVFAQGPRSISTLCGLKLTIVSLTKDGSVQNWNDIAVLLPGRTNKDCRKRWSKIQEDIRKGAWTRDEDERLQQAVQQFGSKLVTPSISPRIVDGSWLRMLVLTICSS